MPPNLIAFESRRWALKYLGQFAGQVESLDVKTPSHAVMRIEDHRSRCASVIAFLAGFERVYGGTVGPRRTPVKVVG